MLVKKMLLSTVVVAAVALVGSGEVLAKSSEQYKQGIGQKQPRAVKLAPRTDAAASTDETQLLASLKAVVIVDNPAAVKKRGTSAAGVEVRSDTVPQAVAGVAEAYLGQPVSPASLDRMTRDMVLAYRAVGIPVVNIVVPPQDVTNGTVQVVAVVGKLGRVSVEGNPTDPDYYIDGFSLQPGDIITEAAVVDQLRWKSRRLNRRVDAIYSPGDSFSLTDIAFDVKERRPFSVFAGIDNTGSSGVGDLRMYSGFTASNLWHKDHELSYQFTTSEKGVDNLAAHTASYTMPVHGRTDLQLSGSYVKSSADVGPGTSEGRSYSLAGTFISQLPRMKSVSLDAHYGYEYKNTNNAFDFGVGDPFGNVTEVSQFFFQVLGQRGTSQSSTQFDLGVWASPGGMFSHNSDTAFDASRPGAQADYLFTRASFDHTIFLPRDFMIKLEAEGQWASNRLPISEMMYLGGMNSVRGFDESAVRGDNGLLGHFEVYTPALSLLDRQGKTDALRLFGFVDAGVVGVNSPKEVGDGTASLVGAGVGLNYQFRENLTAELAYGWKVDSDSRVHDDNGEVHFRLMARF